MLDELQKKQREDAVIALRKGLADARRAAIGEAGRADSGAGEVSGDLAATTGTAVQAKPGSDRPASKNHRGADGNGGRAEGRSGTPGSIKRSPTQIALGKRRDDRGSGKNHAGAGGDRPTGLAEGSGSPTTFTRKSGGLETDEPIPARKIEPEFQPGATVAAATRSKKREIPTKEKTEKAAAGKEPLLPWLKNGGVLSEEEAKHFYEPLAKAFQDFGGYADEGLQWYNAAEIAPNIWDFDDEEADVFARNMIRWGKSSPQAAKAVRGMVYSADYIALGTMFIPRIILTANYMQQSPRATKKRQAQAERKK